MHAAPADPSGDAHPESSPVQPGLKRRRRLLRWCVVLAVGYLGVGYTWNHYAGLIHADAFTGPLVELRPAPPLPPPNAVHAGPMSMLLSTGSTDPRWLNEPVDAASAGGVTLEISALDAGISGLWLLDPATAGGLPTAVLSAVPVGQRYARDRLAESAGPQPPPAPLHAMGVQAIRISGPAMNEAQTLGPGTVLWRLERRSDTQAQAVFEHSTPAGPVQITRRFTLRSPAAGQQTNAATGAAGRAEEPVEVLIANIVEAPAGVQVSLTTADIAGLTHARGREDVRSVWSAPGGLPGSLEQTVAVTRRSLVLPSFRPLQGFRPYPTMAEDRAGPLATPLVWRHDACLLRTHREPGADVSLRPVLASPIRLADRAALDFTAISTLPYPTDGGALVQTLEIFTARETLDSIAPIPTIRGWLRKHLPPSLSVLLLLAAGSRLLTTPLLIRHARRQARIAHGRPALEAERAAIYQQHGQDNAALEQALADLHARHQTNPFAAAGGCLPILIELPLYGLVFSMAAASPGQPLLWAPGAFSPDSYWMLPLAVYVPFVSMLAGPVDSVNLLALAVGVVLYQRLRPAGGASTRAVWIALAVTCLLYNAPAAFCLFLLFCRLLDWPAAWFARRQLTVHADGPARPETCS